MDTNNQLTIYQTPDGKTKLDVKIEGETVWLSQSQMAELFQKDVRTISEHIRNIFLERELNESVSTSKSGNSGNSFVKPTTYYNLPVVIAVGYRVKSDRGTQFRIWATQRLEEYIVKGFTMDDTRLKQGGHRSRYFEELLQRIRDIRSSERMLYQKVTDIYSTAIDYRKNAKETELFFKTVQNKMHYATTGKTAAEIITERANSKKLNMGLTNFPGNNLIKRDIYVAKNYLNEKELQLLNRIVDAYLSFAELQATNEQPMTMQDWIDKLDEYLKMAGKGVLKNAGKISMENAEKKASKVFAEYKELEDKKIISDFDQLQRLVNTSQ